VGNYRNTVETLKKEKEALMELQQGGEGEKSNLLASSQKALARAAQLVSDTAEMRKKEAQAALDKIEGQTQMNLAERLEKLVPRSVAAMEISAIKGELLVAKVAGLASGSLDANANEINYRAHASKHHYEFQLGHMADLDQIGRNVVIAPSLDEEGNEVVPERRI
jgi:uncharacterized protein (DUF3084 family)